MPLRLGVNLDRLDSAASEQGLTTDTKLARKLGVAKSTLSRVKAGTLEPGPTFVAGLLVHFPGDAQHILRVTKARAARKAKT